MKERIFQTKWWCELISFGKMSDVEVKIDGKVHARWPLFLQEGKFKTIYSVMPPLTPFLGPVFFNLEGSLSNQFDQQKKLVNELLSLMPKIHYFNQSLSPDLHYFLPYEWNQFKVGITNTYQISPLIEDDLMDHLSANKRRDINKAKRTVDIEFDLDVKLLFKLGEKTFKRQNLIPPYSLELLEAIYQEVYARGVGKSIYAIDKDKNIHCALLLVWDEDYVYYLMAGNDPDYRNSEATTLLIYEAIKLAHSMNKIFDFEGSSIEGIERFFRSFSSTFVPMLHLEKYSYKRGRLLQLKSIF